MVKKIMNENDGFTLAELLIVVAIIGVLVAISIPIFSSQLEKSREATDLANVRSAYAKIMAEAIDTEIPEPIQVYLMQKKPGWQTSSTLTVGGISNNDKDNWVGEPDEDGFCMVSYEKDKGAILNWAGGYSGTTDLSQNTYLNYDTLKSTGNMDTCKAYFSSQTFRIGAKTVTVRVYYAGGGPFKDALDNWTLQPSTYENSPFYNVQDKTGGTETKDGFAYYTFGKDNKIDNFIYVSPTAVYQTRDKGKTWYNITSSTKNSTGQEKQ